MGDRPTNWAGNITFAAQRLHRPTSLDELRHLVAGSRRIRAFGSGHSFNSIGDSDGDRVTVADLPPSIEIDATRSTVTVGGGVRYGELAQHLHREGYGLHNLGSLPHISVAGACATGTHGSGVTNGNLATAVRAIELVTASGDVVTIERTSADFAGSVVALGLLGIVTRVTLDVVPTFEIAQYIYDDLPFAAAQAHLDAVFATAYSVSLFTNWRDPVVNQVWLKHRTDETGQPDAVSGPWLEGLGAVRANGPRHPVPGVDTVSCTEQGGVPGAWYERLPHFKLNFNPSHGEELQSEYFVARDSAAGALNALHSIRQVISPLLLISELRTIAADELWLSPAYQRDSMAIHFTWVRNLRAVAPVLAAIEEQLAPYAARPHWGKVFSTSPDVVQSLYDRLPDFSAVVTRFDPDRKFRNDFVDRYIP
jgi:alditol oxidase